MTVLRNICECVIQGHEVKEARANSTKRKRLHMKVLYVEKRMFDIYMKTGRSRKGNFPFEMLGKILYVKSEEAKKIAETLFDAGWKPEIHVMLTRKKFEAFYYIGKSISF